MSIQELITITDELSYEDKTTLLRHLIYDMGLDVSIKTIQSYALNGCEPNSAREEQILDFLFWIDDEVDESTDPEEEQENQIMAREIQAYEQMHSELQDEYLGQYVAIHQGELVDQDKDQMLLYHRIRDKYGNTPILMRQVQEVAVQTIQMPSSMTRLSYLSQRY